MKTLRKQAVRIVDLLRAGLEPKQVKARTGADSGLVSYWTRQLGLRFKRGRPPGIYCPKTKDIIAALRRNSKSQATIAKEFKVSRQYVGQVKDRHLE